MSPTHESCCPSPLSLVEFRKHFFSLKLGHRNRNQVPPIKFIPRQALQFKTEQQEEMGTHSAFISLAKVTEEATGFGGRSGKKQTSKKKKKGEVLGAEVA